MSDFSFSYEKKDNIYLLSVMLKKQGIAIRITAKEHGWVVSYIPPSNGYVHPFMNDIRECLLQYALYEIYQNEALKDELFQCTSVPRHYKNIIENAFEKPYLSHPAIDLESFTEDNSKLILNCVLFHKFALEKVKVIFNVTNAGYEPIEVIREDALKELEKEGFPFHLLSDEQILTVINEHEELQQKIQNYTDFAQHILALKQPSFTYSFRIVEYEKEGEYQKFLLRLNHSSLRFTAEFIKDQLSHLSFEMVINNYILSYLSEESMFTSLYDQLCEFITKKSIYRLRILL